ncbi:hypothetical protein ABZ922_44735 [Streptomyces shenzhenensis]|uniref:hypothetical protein n=1 Tax=Streptomyces shenzhenensis TaxID=943815 RepID=UPI0033D3D143
MTADVSSTDLRDTVTRLSSPPLIRLITEIDDNGPIPARGLSRTLADLSGHQLRQAADEARNLGLVGGHPGAGMELTDAGSELADIYDESARWARRHAYPTTVSDFAGRVQRTLILTADTLAPTTGDTSRRPADDRPAGAHAEADLTRLRNLLLRWLTAYPQAPWLAEAEPAA